MLCVVMVWWCWGGVSFQTRYLALKMCLAPFPPEKYFPVNHPWNIKIWKNFKVFIYLKKICSNHLENLPVLRGWLIAVNPVKNHGCTLNADPVSRHHKMPVTPLYKHIFFVYICDSSTELNRQRSIFVGSFSFFLNFVSMKTNPFPTLSQGFFPLFTSSTLIEKTGKSPGMKLIIFAVKKTLINKFSTNNINLITLCLTLSKRIYDYNFRTFPSFILFP